MDQETEQEAPSAEPAAATTRYTSDGAPLVGAAASRSSLNLPGGPPSGPLPAPQPAAAPPAGGPSLQEGVKRARNIGKALAMIALLLARYFVVKVVGGRLHALYARGFILAARVLQALYILLKPHLDRWRAQLKHTTNRVVRLVLVLLISLLGPLERLVGFAVKGAKDQGARLASQGAKTTVAILAPLAQALLQAIQSGFKKQVVQKALARLINVLEEAQK